MTIAPGTRLGRYEVRALLGAGTHVPPAEVLIPTLTKWFDGTMGPVER